YACPMSAPSHDPLHREDGRRLFGLDPAVSDAGRPQYPPALYDALERRCGLGDAARILEIGPGTGLVTRRLLATGASVVAVEPNANLAAFLRDSFGGELRVVEALFEEADLESAAFDLAVAATSFHWVDPEAGLATVARALRPGGAVALWWTLFQDPTARDDFSRAARAILPATGMFDFDDPDRPPFQLDADRRLLDLRQWGGFVETEAEIFSTPVTLAADQVRALYASVATVLRLSPEARTDVLDQLEALVHDEFGGAIDRTFVTALYTGRRPGGDGHDAKGQQ
ncbi:MAG TPA: methyltransferase domain-containing protein, partial [Acidimicrobiales bacterium]|nr:methyltransferase domain-containing protein [Acidimicrobiales bacterium]